MAGASFGLSGVDITLTQNMPTLPLEKAELLVKLAQLSNAMSSRLLLPNWSPKRSDYAKIRDQINECLKLAK